MPPKKQDAPPLPEVEEEVALPEEVSDFQEPSYCLVLGHLAGSSFRVQPPAVPDPETGESTPAPLQDFDPSSLVLAQAKQPPGDAPTRVVLLDKEEMQAYCSEAYGLQDQPLWAGLKLRLEKERAARSRAKSNAARRKAIAALEAAAEGAAEAAEEKEEQGKPEVDALFLIEAPADAEELQAMSDAGLYEVVDLWTSIYFAGASVEESDPTVEVAAEVPPGPQLFFEAIHAASKSADVANSTVCAVPDSHALAFQAEPPEGSEEAPPPETTPSERVFVALFDVVGREAASRMRFQAWLEAAEKVKVPDAPTNSEGLPAVVEDRLYQSMMSSVDQAYHDIPLFLHCLTDQVERTLSGDAQQKEDEIALSSLEEYLATAFEDAVCEGTAPPEPGARSPVAPPASEALPGLPGSGPLLQFLDRAACRHQRGAGARLQGEPVLASVHEVLGKISVPGSRRSGLPESAVLCAREREALRHRFYPFAPGAGPEELEQLLLMHAFQDLLAKAQPERSWCCADRIWREQIPASLLGQTLEAALRTEPFADATYLPRHDTLLLALHHRSVPGRVIWHAWQGDLLTEAQDAKWQSSALVTHPTYNDWSQVHGAGLVSNSTPKKLQVVENMDARDVGYNAIVEKLACPVDGSLILATRLESGIRTSFPEPGSEVPAGRFPADPTKSRRLARVFKEGLVFGMVADETWRRWQLDFQQKAAPEAPAEEDSPAGEEEPPQEGPLPFADTQLGVLWMALPCGARVTARPHHESARKRGLLDEAVANAMPLPSMGITMTYTILDGQTVQVFSDGSVQLSRPVEGRGTMPEAATGLVPYLPGCAADREVVRTITPLGVLIRKLSSGRTEIYYADGKTSFRNPTLEELERELEAYKSKPSAEYAARVDLLTRMLQVYSGLFPPSPKEVSNTALAAGLPGHWVTLRADGNVFGRFAKEPEAPPEAEGEEPPADPQPSLKELLRAYPVDSGGLEYEIDPIATALQVDLYTRHKALTNSRGFASFEDPEGVQKVCVYPDGSRITNTSKEYGTELEIFNEGMPLIRCEIPKPGSSGGLQLQVECADGTTIEVVPQNLSGGSFKQITPEEDCVVANASICLSCSDGNVVRAGGDGCVQICKESEGTETSSYMAYCAEGKLVTGDTEETEFTLFADQSLQSPGMSSPRCLEGNKAYFADAAEDTEAPEPRLFVIHGTGEAEELLSSRHAAKILQAAHDDTTALVVGPEPLSERLQNFKCHTIFKTRLPDALTVPQMGSLALPDSLDGGGSICSVISQASQQASQQVSQQAETTQAGAITEFRQLIEYPPVSEEDQIKLKGTLKQYREWEAAQLQKMRDAAKPPDPKGAKAKKDKGKDKAKEKGKKGKKGKKEEEVVEEAKEIPPDPAFAQGLKLDAFEHCVKALQGRLDEQAAPGSAELLSRALAVLAVADGEAAGVEPEPQEVAEGEAQEEGGQKEAEGTDGAGTAEGPSMDQENIAPQATKAKKGKKRLPVAETEWSFSYFNSETGLQFLMDTGMLDPDMKPRQASVVKEKRARPPPPPPPRTPWNPRLVGEPTEEPEQEASPENHSAEDEEEVEEGWPGDNFREPEFGVPEDEDQRQFFHPQQRVPIMPVHDEAPLGPHPDKKGPTWDVYGEPRGPKGKISQAYVGMNADYMEVEGPAGRKTNTAALAHKRSHVKGLGDNHMLAEVMPGACRFGPLRQGSLYRMHVYVRNLEVDVTRFNVKPPESKLVNVKWQPGHLAPGMATKLTVEVLALEPARIEQLLEVHTKAHIIRVPVTARIVGAEEYDRLDAESMALHGRRIGRHREKSETHKPGPVQLITEPSYCRKVMGQTWQPPPVEFDDLPATELLR